MKCFILFFTLLALLPLSVRADYIFEQSYEFAVLEVFWNVSGMDGGDFNNDGIPDFAFSQYHRLNDYGYLYTFLGNGDCTFNTIITIYDYVLGSITVNDFNNDGYDDLLIGEGYGDYYDYPVESDIVHRLAGNGDGTFTELDTLHVSNIWVTSGDLNDDGNCDIVTASVIGGIDCAVLVKPGNGDFTFQETASYEIPPLIRHTVQILGDMDLDGNVDIGVLAGWITFLYGNGDGTFQPAENVAYHGSLFCYCFIEAGDFNEDGMPDMATTGSCALPTYDEVLVWDGIGTYLYDPADTIGAQGNWLEVNDFDMDGHLDVAVSSSGYGYVLPGYGDGTFSFDLLLKTTYDRTYSVLSEDFDLDGDYDLVFCEDAHSQIRCIRCYRNTTITQGCEGESESSLTSVVLDVSPNPFSASVSIEVTGYSDDSGNLQIFDLSGRLVAELESFSGEGKAVFHWNGVSSSGAEVPSGIYTARLYSGNTITTAELLKLE